MFVVHSALGLDIVSRIDNKCVILCSCNPWDKYDLCLSSLYSLRRNGDLFFPKIEHEWLYTFNRFVNRAFHLVFAA